VFAFGVPRTAPDLFFRATCDSPFGPSFPFRRARSPRVFCNPSQIFWIFCVCQGRWVSPHLSFFTPWQYEARFVPLPLFSLLTLAGYRVPSLKPLSFPLNPCDPLGQRMRTQPLSLFSWVCHQEAAGRCSLLLSKRQTLPEIDRTCLRIAICFPIISFFLFRLDRGRFPTARPL